MLISYRRYYSYFIFFTKSDIFVSWVFFPFLLLLILPDLSGNLLEYRSCWQAGGIVQNECTTTSLITFFRLLHFFLFRSH